MNEVTGPIVATALVLCAVFMPTAFISGLTGQFYKQFALTIAISTVISAFNSLTLSPALCAVLLKDHHAPKDWLWRAMERRSAGFSIRSTVCLRGPGPNTPPGVGSCCAKAPSPWSFTADWWC
jgi:multidrug efflux pump subunit AcrB